MGWTLPTRGYNIHTIQKYYIFTPSILQKSKHMKDQIGEEILGTPISLMDRIIEIDKRFTVINTLLEILCKEMGISPESQPKAVLQEIGKNFEEYYKAMEEFRNLKKDNEKLHKLEAK